MVLFVRVLSVRAMMYQNAKQSEKQKSKITILTASLTEDFPFCFYNNSIM